MNDPRTEARSRDVVLLSPKRVLASSLRAVLEPHGFGLHHVPDIASLEPDALVRMADIVILDEAVADAGLDLVAGDPRPGGPELPVLLYTTGSWDSLDRTASTRLDAVRNAVWDVVVEPIRSQDLVRKLNRLSDLQSLWRTAAETGMVGSEGFDAIVEGLPILDSIASRSGTRLGCVMLGPTRHAPGETRDPRLSDVKSRIRGSDLHAWVGPSELVVILYGADVMGAGSFVSRVVGGEGHDLSAGIAPLDPRSRSRGSGAGGTSARHRLRVLDRLFAARRALDEARQAGGGVRVARTEVE
ncbi:MAG: hypothetical protein R3195_07120 [Gemmatimonadota bacterium]|nr:hypothetical protein [Gemmatimonadota bacterium]